MIGAKAPLTIAQDIRIDLVCIWQLLLIICQVGVHS